MTQYTVVFECKIYVQELEKYIDLSQYIDIHYGPEIIVNDFKKNISQILKIKNNLLNIKFVKKDKIYLFVNYTHNKEIDLSNNWIELMTDYDEYIEYEDYQDEITVNTYIKKTNINNLNELYNEDWENNANSLFTNLSY